MSKTRLAELRARRALAGARLDPDVALRPLESVTNEVWAAGDVVVRVNRKLHSRLRREAQIAALLPPAVPYPRVIATGESHTEAWAVVAKAPGVPLVRCWPGLTFAERHRAIDELAAAVQALHRTVVPPELAEPGDTPQLLRAGSGATEGLLRALEQVGQLPHVDRGLVAEAIGFVQSRRGVLDPFESSTLIHGDLHLQNVLWDGEHVTALLDLEFARAAPPDLDLDVFLRFCAYPFLFVPEGREDEARALDYVEVPFWFRDAYPDLFSRPDQLDRLRIYSIGFLAKELLALPPRGSIATLTPSHPYRRLRNIVRRTSHLDSLAAG